MKKGLAIILLLGSVHIIYANVYTEVDHLKDVTSTLSGMPVFTIQYIHLVAVTIILGLLSVIAVMRFRLSAQRRRQMDKDRITAARTEALNKKYRLVLRANHTTVWKWDLVTKEIECERECCLIKEQGACKRFTITENSFYSRIHPDDLEKIHNTYKRLMRGEITMFHEEFRYRLLAAPNEYNWVESFAIVGESEPGGQASTLVGGVVVVTERKRLEQEALKKEQAEEANRMKSAFLSSIRHEIRTPLNAIVGFSNLIVQGSDPEEAVEYGKIVQQNSTLLVQLVEDVLDLSDVESGQMVFSYSPVDVSEMLLMLEQNYRSRAKEGVWLTCELPAQSYFANVDGNRLVQVLKNFLSNACKFTSSGYICMGFEQTTDGLYFYVTDTGKGIAKKNLPQVFERFAKFDSFTQGAGLGLSLCRSLVHKMEGEIGVYSDEGKGSTFWFSIPCIVHVDPEIPGLNEEINEKINVEGEAVLA